MLIRESKLREVIRGTLRRALNEDFSDITYVKAKIRVQINRPDDPSMADILTDLRGAENVITVRQTEPMIDAPENKNMVSLNVGYDPSSGMRVEDLRKVLMGLRTVDMVKILTVDGVPYNPKGGTPASNKSPGEVPTPEAPEAEAEIAPPPPEPEEAGDDEDDPLSVLRGL